MMTDEPFLNDESDLNSEHEDEEKSLQTTTDVTWSINVNTRFN